MADKTKVKLVDGMKFQSIRFEEGNEFEIHKYDYYSDDNPIWCAYSERSIYPLTEICLEDYIPMVDGVWFNEPVEYEF